MSTAAAAVKARLDAARLVWREALELASKMHAALNDVWADADALREEMHLMESEYWELISAERSDYDPADLIEFTPYTPEATCPSPTSPRLCA